MYSKANSEAEYTDLKTLWDRANDAINTIIRRDESIETGEVLLQPCIEVDQYSRILLRDEDLGVDNFNPQRYVSIIRKEGLEISQPTLDFSKTEVNYMEKLSKEEGIQKKLSKDILQYKAHIIKIFAEHRHNWISADLEF
ncbi:uncharacterized protein LOC133720590 isoform X2 [Rosa rugosa]|uniref:uncharacterized protein LOC133720590 isoform X2 n=1 Tax=Rosa rugosa TaxID=74645 RepID=UPI002B40E6A8|nr:uncharacterized protein LOC133720590 isoform X2 [Rosa rugosa]